MLVDVYITEYHVFAATVYEPHCNCVVVEPHSCTYKTLLELIKNVIPPYPTELKVVTEVITDELPEVGSVWQLNQKHILNVEFVGYKGTFIS